MGKVSNKLGGIGHVVSEIELHTTPKGCRQQSFKAGYTVYKDTSFKAKNNIKNKNNQPHQLMQEQLPHSLTSSSCDDQE